MKKFVRENRNGMCNQARCVECRRSSKGTGPPCRARRPFRPPHPRSQEGELAPLQRRDRNRPTRTHASAAAPGTRPPRSLRLLYANANISSNIAVLPLARCLLDVESPCAAACAAHRPLISPPRCRAARPPFPLASPAASQPLVAEHLRYDFAAVRRWHGR